MLKVSNLAVLFFGVFLLAFCVVAGGVFAACAGNDTCNTTNCVLSSGGCRDNYPGSGPKDTCKAQANSDSCGSCSCQPDGEKCVCDEKPKSS